MIAYGLLFILGPAATDAWVEEDRIVETLSAVALLATSIFFLLMLIKGRREKRYGTLKQIALFGFVLLFFVAAGEEISWGQRYLGIATPPELMAENDQGELNLHNLRVFDEFISFDRLAQLFWLMYGVLIPVTAALSKRAGSFLNRYLPVMPVWVAVFLIFDQVVAWSSNLVNYLYPTLYTGRYYEFGAARYEVTEGVVTAIFAAGACALYLRMRSPLTPGGFLPRADSSFVGVAGSSARHRSPSK